MKKNNDKITTFFTIYSNVHTSVLIKDNGMIPAVLSRLGLYDSYYVSYIPEDTEDEYVKYVKACGLKLIHVDHIFTENEQFTWHSPTLRVQSDMMKFIWKNASKMNVLNLYFVKTSILYALLYKLLNPKGKCYVKADVNIEDLADPNTFTGKIKTAINRWYLNLIPDLVSVESQKALHVFQERYKLSDKKLKYIPNGVDDSFLSKIKLREYSEKENIILTVARFGTKQKNTPFLLRVCTLLKGRLNGWKFIAIGLIDPTFIHDLEEFYKNNPDMKDVIEFVGPINDRYKLFEYYNKAKIFCLTSTHESFGISYVEALSMGCYIVSTPVVPLTDFIYSKEGSCGIACESEKQMADAISNIIENEDILRQAYPSIIQHSKQFYLNTIYSKLATYL